MLTARARRARGEQRDVLRARIVLAAAAGQPTPRSPPAGSARGHGAQVAARFAADGMPGLDDRPRSGRPRVFTAGAGGRGEGDGLRAAGRDRGAAGSLVQSPNWPPRRSPAAWWNACRPPRCAAGWTRDAIKPWQYRSWIFPRDPDFAAKAARVLDLYDRLWKGRALGADEFVISADEKSQLQALRRRHPELPPAPGRVRRRGVRVPPRRHPGLPGRLRRPPRPGDRPIAPTTGIEPFSRPGRAGDDQRALRQRRRVFWVVDNGSSHNGRRSIQRMRDAWPDRRTGPPAGPRPAGSTRSRSTSPSCNAKSSSPSDFDDLDALAATGSSPSKTATTPPPNPSTGATPANRLDAFLERLALTAA